jgi:hypothetical protein
MKTSSPSWTGPSTFARKGKGRSAVLRQLASDFVRQRREREIDAQYERAYKGVKAPLGEEFAGWEDEGIGPPE